MCAVLDGDTTSTPNSGLCAQVGTLPIVPVTVEAETGGGGRHLYFTHPGGEVRNRAGMAPGLDLRGDGGMIIAPPSIHPSGRPCRWRKGRSPSEVDLAPLPAWILTPRFGGDDRHGHPIAYWRDLVREGVSEGQRNSTLASLTGHLLWQGVDPDVILELMLSWTRTRCRPPLPDAEVIAIIRSIEQTHRRHGGEGSIVTVLIIAGSLVSSASAENTICAAKLNYGKKISDLSAEIASCKPGDILEVEAHTDNLALFYNEIPAKYCDFRAQIFRDAQPNGVDFR